MTSPENQGQTKHVSAAAEPVSFHIIATTHTHCPQGGGAIELRSRKRGNLFIVGHVSREFQSAIRRHWPLPPTVASLINE